MTLKGWSKGREDDLVRVVAPAKDAGNATLKKGREMWAILKEVGMGDLMGRRPGEMSGDQQQRVAVARAIVSEPALVLADEPTANLDSKTGERLLALMKSLNRDKGITFVFSTHDKMVMERAQRVILLRDGMVVETVVNGL